MKYLSKVVQQAGRRADVGPAAVFPARVQPLVIVGLPCLILDQNHIEMFLGPSQPLGQNTTVTLIHKQQNTSCPAAGQVGQQFIDWVSLLQVSLQREGDVWKRHVRFFKRMENVCTAGFYQTQQSRFGAQMNEGIILHLFCYLNITKNSDILFYECASWHTDHTDPAEVLMSRWSVWVCVCLCMSHNAVEIGVPQQHGAVIACWRVQVKNQRVGAVLLPADVWHVVTNHRFLRCRVHPLYILCGGGEEYSL